VDRGVRNLQHTKQKSTSIDEVLNTRIEELTEGVPKLMYIKGYGLYSVVRYKNQLWYNQYSTSR